MGCQVPVTRPTQRSRSEGVPGCQPGPFRSSGASRAGHHVLPANHRESTPFSVSVGRALASIAVTGEGEFSRVETQKTVHGVSRRVGRRDQVRTSERHQQPAGVSHCGAHQGGTRMRFYAGARVQAQQPEGTGGVAVEMLIGPGEYRANSRSRIASASEQVKPLVTVAQLPHQPDKPC
jgi:hypothetical protein